MRLSLPRFPVLNFTVMFELDKLYDLAWKWQMKHVPVNSTCAYKKAEKGVSNDSRFVNIVLIIWI